MDYISINEQASVAIALEHHRVDLVGLYIDFPLGIPQQVLHPLLLAVEETVGNPKVRKNLVLLRFYADL
jgi:hypothetical protein